MFLTVNSYFFILNSGRLEYLRGMCLKLKRSFRCKMSYFPELTLNYISFKTKSKSDMNI